MYISVGVRIGRVALLVLIDGQLDVIGDEGGEDAEATNGMSPALGHQPVTPIVGVNNINYRSVNTGFEKT